MTTLSCYLNIFSYLENADISLFTSWKFTITSSPLSVISVEAKKKKRKNHLSCMGNFILAHKMLISFTHD